MGGSQIFINTFLSVGDEYHEILTLFLKQRFTVSTMWTSHPNADFVHRRLYLQYTPTCLYFCWLSCDGRRITSRLVSTLITEKLLNLGVVGIDRSKPFRMVSLNVIQINLSSNGIGNEIGVETIIRLDELPIALSTACHPTLENFFSRKIIILQIKMREIAFQNDF